MAGTDNCRLRTNGRGNWLNKMKARGFRLISLALICLALGALFILAGHRFARSDSEELAANTHFSFPRDKNFFENAFKFKKKQLDLSQKSAVAGVISHHLLAADLLAEFFANLQGRDFDAIILLGPNHFNAGEADIITSGYDWQTPYGVLENDQDFFKQASGWDNVGIDEEVISGEHAIYAEAAFIKKIFPRAEFLPIILKSGVKAEQAEALANNIFDLSQSKKILLLASVDFSHYQDSLTAQNNDQKSLAAIYGFDFDKIYSLDIDSPPSIYALLKFSQSSGAKFELLHNSNSALLADKPDIESATSYVTGYFTRQDNAGLSLSNGKKADNPINMLFFGDMMLDRFVAEKIKQNGLGYIFGRLDKDGFYDGHDLISANLEGAVTGAGAHYPPVKEFDFAFNPEVMAGLKRYNFNFFNLANNHFGDQGEQGMDETRKNLDKLGFYYAGCDNGITGDCSARIIDVKGYKIGMIGFGAVGNVLDASKSEQIIRELKDKTDLVMVNAHWGEEYSAQFNRLQQELAHGFIDAGADAVIGHHPHVAQGMEVYKNKPIFYSLGNFVFDQYFSAETQTGLAVEFIFNGQGLDYKLHPFASKNSQIRLLDAKEKDDFLGV